MNETSQDTGKFLVGPVMIVIDEDCFLMRVNYATGLSLGDYRSSELVKITNGDREKKNGSSGIQRRRRELSGEHVRVQVMERDDEGRIRGEYKVV